MIDAAYETVTLALANHLTVDPLAFEARQDLEEDWGLDPFDVTLLAIGMEEDLDIELSLARLQDVKTVGDLVTIVRMASEAREWERSFPEYGRPRRRAATHVST